jgi:hypothetical protein
MRIGEQRRPASTYSCSLPAELRKHTSLHPHHAPLPLNHRMCYPIGTLTGSPAHLEDELLTDVRALGVLTAREAVEVLVLRLSWTTHRCV